jgi:putative methyltransferase (TIGR04325 family)
MTNLIKQMIPPFILSVIKKIIRWAIHKDGFWGRYYSWEEAKKKCSGYDADNILEKVKSAALNVKNGTTVYERDSCCFYDINYSFAIISFLLKAAIENNNKLNVLDFGGSLGSTYYQNRQFLPDLREFSWNIVEQSNFVTCGIQNFQDNTLHFYSTVEECKQKHDCNVLLLSGVIQYLEKPFEMIEQFKAMDCDYIIIDRTPFTHEKKDFISIQKVSPKIYSASYPHYFFNEDNFVSAILSDTYGGGGKYTLYYILEDIIDSSNFPNTYYKGFIFRRKTLNKNEK